MSSSKAFIHVRLDLLLIDILLKYFETVVYETFTIVPIFPIEICSQ